MAYTPPIDTGVSFDLSSGYTAPADDAVNFALSNTVLIPEGTIAGVTGAAAGQIAAEIDQNIQAGTIAGTTGAAAGQIAAGHGTNSSLSGAISATAGALQIEHGVTGTMAGSTGTTSGQIDALMIVFALSGGVKDGDSVPLERRVRAYRRSTGELVSETDSAPGSGYFDMNVGFTADEFTILAIDLDPAATDYTPSITNRVESVLRYD